MRTKEEAEVAGQELLSKMHGHGWTLRVWENAGWHYCVINNPLSIHPLISGKYFCLMGDGRYAGTGLSMWSDDNHYTDPNEAVRAQIAAAEKVVNQLTLALQLAKIGAGADKYSLMARLTELYHRHDPDGCGCREVGNGSFMCQAHKEEARQIEEVIRNG